MSENLSPARRRWVATAGAALTPGTPAEASNALWPMVVMIGGDLPDGAFTTESVKAVVLADRYGVAPAYDVLFNTLSEWWKEHAPRQTRIEHDGPLTAKEQSWVDYFYTREAEGFRATRPGDKTSSREHCLSLVRSVAPRAWEMIVQGSVSEVA